jgi:hypothetical protein
MDSCVDPDDVLTASDFVTMQTLEEVDAAVAQTRACTYSCAISDPRPPPAHRIAVEGIMQPIYSCTTCAAANGGTDVGVCEPCALRCHAEHELVEVGIRRTFKCDCPTTRSSVPCTSGGPAPPVAPCASNRYGQNFAGRFCTCARPYDKARDEMLQCVACDEWFHDVHIPGHLPSSFEFDGGMVCAACVRGKAYLRPLSTFTPGHCAAAPKQETAPVEAALGASPQKTDAPPAAAAAAASPAADSAAPQSPVVVSSSGGDAAAAGGPTAASSPTDSAAGAPPAFPLQPWVACLTCTEGADDGRGVCMACAAKCHVGHIMTKPRISQFACDCTELLLGKRDLGCASPPLTSCQCAPFSAPSAQQVPLWCASTAPGLPVGASGLAAEGTPAPQAESPVTDPQRVFVEGASIFLSADDELLAALCNCDACMGRYAADGVATWWLQAEDAPADPSAPITTGLDEAALRRVPGLIDAVMGDLRRQRNSSGSLGGVAAGAAASAAGSSSSGGGSAASAAAGPLAPSASASVEAAAGALADAIESLRRNGFQTTYEAGMQALAALPALEQVQALTSYGALEAELMPFLRTFAETGRVVTAADIQGFFANLQAGRRVRSRLG